MEVHYLSTMQNFYYSLLASVLINKKYATTLTHAERKKHINTWLNNTKRDNNFGRIVITEITWLQEELTKRSCDQLEVMLMKIFRSCIKLQSEEKQNRS
ncbi:hypothetical protein ACULN0_04300 [Pectobacterium actinidiae]|uniref:hypothetical protein n=1 Tax=Pectobacterium actinidiae TaxID=1507808 RepID=UPI004040BC95